MYSSCNTLMSSFSLWQDLCRKKKSLSVWRRQRIDDDLFCVEKTSFVGWSLRRDTLKGNRLLGKEMVSSPTGYYNLCGNLLLLTVKSKRMFQTSQLTWRVRDIKILGQKFSWNRQTVKLKHRIHDKESCLWHERRLSTSEIVVLFLTTLEVKTSKVVCQVQGTCFDF